jgi:hypothetical protein
MEIASQKTAGNDSGKYQLPSAWLGSLGMELPRWYNNLSRQKEP